MPAATVHIPRIRVRDLLIQANYLFWCAPGCRRVRLEAKDPALRSGRASPARLQLNDASACGTCSFQPIICLASTDGSVATAARVHAWRTTPSISSRLLLRDSSLEQERTRREPAF